VSKNQIKTASDILEAVFLGGLNPFQMKANGNHDADGKYENVKGSGKKDGTYSLKNTDRNNELCAYPTDLSQPRRQGIRVIFSHMVPP
jgi:hypothetical protein